VKNIAQESNKPLSADAASFKPFSGSHNTSCHCRTFIPNKTTSPKLCGTPILHTEASFHHLSRDKITVEDLEPNLSQMSQSFWIISKACDFRLQTTQKACDFWRTAAFSLSFVCCVVIADFNLKKFECMCFVENLKRLIEVILLKCRK